MFDDDDLLAKLETMDSEQLHALPLGVIKLDSEHKITFYSAAEARLSGYGDRPALGLNYLTQVAPCMNTPEFRGRLESAQREGSFDVEFGLMGDFSDRNRLVRTRIMSASGGGVWIVKDRH